jgi:hypothetical protein
MVNSESQADYQIFGGHGEMRVLVACEESQEVTKRLRAKGHEAFSCDILECSGGHPEWHLPKAERAKLRSKTFPGIAQAMADQWS